MKHKHIILIDDNKIDCFIHKKIISLANPKTQITVFHDAIAALNYFNQNKYNTKIMPVDLILLDINMPLMNGFDFLERLSKIKSLFNPQIPIYFLTSSCLKSDVEKALNTKYCSGYINKPLTKEKLNEITQPIDKSMTYNFKKLIACM